MKKKIILISALIYFMNLISIAQKPAEEQYELWDPSVPTPYKLDKHPKSV
jgi:hypothetical protein